jgi:4-hydroxy-2-oxoheptanedioate aldolase
MFRPNRLKQRILAGEKSFGTWLQSGCPAFAEIASGAGFDFFIMDQEHGPGGIETAMEMARAAAGAAATAMVRVPSSHPTYLKRLVDAGIEGILVPMVESGAEAEQVVKACRYPPRGNRGNAADIARCSGYGLQADYLARADDNLLIAVQIETAAAVANAAEIAAVDGVDLVFIGPTDLSGSIGLMGQTGHPKVQALIAETVATVRKIGKPLGTVPRQGRTWQQLFDEGFLFVATGSEIFAYRTHAQDLVAGWRTYQRQLAEPGPVEARMAAGSYGTS